MWTDIIHLGARYTELEKPKHLITTLNLGMFDYTKNLDVKLKDWIFSFDRVSKLSVILPEYVDRYRIMDTYNNKYFSSFLPNTVKEINGIWENTIGYTSNFRFSIQIIPKDNNFVDDSLIEMFVVGYTR